MAIRCPSLHIGIPGGDMKKSSIPKVFMLHNSHMPANRKSTTPITCFNYKVFEDKSKGIVCYMDDQGEVICEGYDEGPRFSQPLQNVYHKREFHVPGFFQQTLLRTSEGIEFQFIKNGISVQDEGLDCVDLNGFF